MTNTKTAIENVLSGRSPEGDPSDKIALNFSKDENVRWQFIVVATQLIEKISDEGPSLPSSRFENLVRKLAGYCVRRGWQTPERIAVLKTVSAQIIDAVLEQPDALDRNVGLQSVLNSHTMHAYQRSAKLMKEYRGVSEPYVVISTCPVPGYKLVELLTPDHLQEESAFLRHCVGTNYNQALLVAKGLDEHHPDAKQYLTYAIKIRNGDKRIFSLRGPKGTPCVTIDYNVGSRCIVQIEGETRKLGGHEPFFPAFCYMLRQLKSMIPIHSIRDMPMAPELNLVLTNEGRWVRPTEVKPENDVFLGHAFLDNSISREITRKLAQAIDVDLDVTNLEDMSCLPARVEGGLYSAAESFSAPTLISAHRVYANNAKTLNVPELRMVGRIEADSVHSFNAPELLSAGAISIKNAIVVDLPKLETAHNIAAHSANIFNIPELVKAGAIWAQCAREFVAPKLNSAGDIEVLEAEKFEAPMLFETGLIHADNAQNFTAARLFSVHYIGAERANTFYAPSLKPNSWISVPS